MKKVILFFAVLFTFGTLNAQISFTNKTVEEVVTVGKVSTPFTVAKLETNNNGTYILTYATYVGNKPMSDYVITFSATKEDIETLYSLFIGAFNEKDIKRYHIELNLGASEFPLTIEGDKYVGMKSIRLSGNHLGKSQYLNKNQVNSLFGKR